MGTASNDYNNAILEIRQAREQAQMWRDQLMGTYQKLLQEEPESGEFSDDEKNLQVREAMRKAIAAFDCGLASIDQALRDKERVRDDQPE